MKKWQGMLVLIIAILVGLNIVKDPIIKTVIETNGSNILGARIEIGSFGLGLFTQKVRIRNLKIYSPEGFPKETMIDIPEVGVDYDLGALLTGKIHLPYVVLNLKEMMVVKNKEGKLNVDSLKVSQTQAKPKEKLPQEKSKEMAISIDLMKLNVERVIFKDFSHGRGEPSIKVFEVALKDKTFKDIKSPQQLVALILVNAMGPTAIQGAGIYAAAAVLGVGFLPAGIVGALVGKDDVIQEYKRGFDDIFKITVDLMKTIGELKTQDKAKGMIKGKVDGVDVAITLTKISDNMVEVKVAARQLMLPKPEVAAGIIYQLNEILK